MNLLPRESCNEYCQRRIYRDGIEQGKLNILSRLLKTSEDVNYFESKTNEANIKIHKVQSDSETVYNANIYIVDIFQIFPLNIFQHNISIKGFKTHQDKIDISSLYINHDCKKDSFDRIHITVLEKSILEEMYNFFAKYDDLEYVK